MDRLDLMTTCPTRRRRVALPPTPFTSAAFVFVLLSLLSSGCGPERKDSAPVASTPIVQTRVHGYVALGDLAPSLTGRPQIDELSTLHTWRDGTHRVSAAPGLFGVRVAGTSIATNSEVLVRDGRLFVPSSAGEAIRRIFTVVPVPIPPMGVFPFHIVLDAGHGGEDPGAIGVTGQKEKEVNLDVVQRLDAFLRAQRVKTTLTRSDNTFPSLEDRVAIANRAAPDLFVSVHSNSSRNPMSTGFEIFDRDTRASVSERAEESALTEPHPKEFNGKPFPADSAGRRAAYEQLFAQYRRDSTEAARCIEQSMTASLPVEDRGVQPHRLHLLRWARCPAILVETAFLSNSHEEALLKDPSFRQQVAEAIGRGLLEFRSKLAARRK